MKPFRFCKRCVVPALERIHVALGENFDVVRVPVQELSDQLNLHTRRKAQVVERGPFLDQFRSLIGSDVSDSHKESARGRQLSMRGDESADLSRSNIGGIDE